MLLCRGSSTWRRCNEEGKLQELQPLPNTNSVCQHQCCVWLQPYAPTYLCIVLLMSLTKQCNQGVTASEV